MVKKINWGIIYKIEFIFICVVCLVLCTGKNYWFDESFSLALMKQDLEHIIFYTASDVHPPLYYLILKCFVGVFGASDVVVHLVSLFPFMALLILFGGKIKRDFGDFAAVLSVFMFAGAPRVLNYSTEVRMYAWAMLFVFTSFLLGNDIAKTEDQSHKKWILFAVLNVLAAYTHYFAGAAVILISGYLMLRLLIKGREKMILFFRWLESSIITFVLYIPWMIVFLKQIKKVKTDYWIPPFQLSELREYNNLLFGKNALVHEVVLLIFVMAVILYLIRREYKKDLLPVLAMLIVFSYIALGVLLSIFFTPVFIQRYIIIVVPIFWYGICRVFCRVNNKYVYGLLVVLSFVCFFKSYEAKFYQGMSKDHRTVAAFIEDNICERDEIIATDTHVIGALNVYAYEFQLYLTKDVIAKEAFVYWNEVGNVSYVDEYSDVNSDRIWLFVYEDMDTNSIKQLKKAGYQVTDVGTYTIPYDGWSGDHSNVEIYACNK